MKKLFLSAAFAFATLTMSAQTETRTESKTETTTVAKTEVEVKTVDIPTAIQDAVKKAYPGAVINSATVNDAKEYALNVTVGEQTGLIYADANGKWIKKD